MDNQEIATKFAQWDVNPLSTLQGSKVYDLRLKLNKGGKMDRTEKNWLAEKLRNNSYFKYAVPLMGWKFDFSDVVKKFLVSQYGQWVEYIAPDKTSLRSVIYGRIDRIVEVD